ncbi:predicted protein [Naegleria gruberi]|uniref:Predicted protein n=1 Tax=Naegleria gruberi TaxID=5762 RepID=D2VNA4_NAEGR|nr:uncharacterized protein NAEGRDRAFT_70426 [Naegleria gruberi]EFC41707.1 predicted protein [Naegleria gruberi]|eukprot:XP_002674451.1 predicted protein [Naegleria gruberi strain NEG-M]
MNQQQNLENSSHAASSRNGLIGGGLFFVNQILLAYRLGFQTLKKTVLGMREQFAANFSKEEEHYVYKQIDSMLRRGSDNPNLHSIVKSLEQVTFYSNQAEALFKFFAKDLKLPIVYGFQPFSQKENYPIDQSTRMGCVSLNNFKIQCVEQPGLNKIRGYISHIFTVLFGERVVGAKKQEEQSVQRNLLSLDGIASLLTSFGSVHTFGLLGVSLFPSASGDSDRKILKSRGIICTSQFKNYHEFYMTKSMLSKLKLEDKKIIGFKQTFLFGTMWEFYRKYIYRNEPFKNHGIYTINYHPFFELVMKLVTEKNVKYETSKSSLVGKLNSKQQQSEKMWKD